MKKISEPIPRPWLPAISCVLTLVTAVMTTGCPTQPPVPPSQPDASAPDEGDAASPATCAAWCKRAREMSCAGGKPTRAGAPCEDVCANVQSGPAKWNLRCRIAAKSCAAADVCE